MLLGVTLSTPEHAGRRGRSGSARHAEASLRSRVFRAPTRCLRAPSRRRILVCYDGSPESERALARVAEIAAATPSHVTVVSVADPIYHTPPYTGYADPALGERTSVRAV